MGKHGRFLRFERPPLITGSAAVVGGKEGDGPLSHTFDIINGDAYFGEKTWEKAESRMMREASFLAMSKAKLAPSEVDVALAGDLVNQCTPSTFGLVEFGIPYVGLFGACSTFAESLALGALMLDGGYAETALCVTSSHFSTAERQFRFPLAYGAQRPPTAQWTVTGSGAMVVQRHDCSPLAQPDGEALRPVRIRGALFGTPVDMGITDANNMGAAMAPAACDSLKRFFRDAGMAATDFDLIATGDLGAVGAAIVADLMARDGMPLEDVYDDCGLMIFDRAEQDVDAGASGCGCSAVVTCGHLLNQLQRGKLNNLLLVGTGALMSPVSFQQGDSIVGIAHCVWLEGGEYGSADNRQ